MYYRMIPALAIFLVVCCLIWALASAFGGSRVGYGGYYPPIFVGSGWSHGGYYHGGSTGGYSGPSGGGAGRSPSGHFGGGGITGGHGGK